MTITKDVIATLHRETIIPVVDRIISKLPDFVVASGTINSFKNNLDKFWFNEEVKYNWKVELTGTGNRSLSCS